MPKFFVLFCMLYFHFLCFVFYIENFLHFDCYKFVFRLLFLLLVLFLCDLHLVRLLLFRLFLFVLLLQKIQKQVESNIEVTIFQGLPKADKMEFIIQKAVELGVYDITPVEMKRCVVKLNEKDKSKKVERWQKISEVAAKQSGRDIIPHINNVINIKNMYELIPKYDIVIVAYENEQNRTLKEQLKQIKEKYKEGKIKIGIVIGPEGGLEENDVEQLENNGAKIVTLGKRILRTETVALNVLSIIMYELEK